MIERTYYINRSLDILKAFESGDRVEEIAIDFDITPQSVRAIIKEERRLIHRYASRYYPDIDDIYCNVKPKKKVELGDT